MKVDTLRAFHQVDILCRIQGQGQPHHSMANLLQLARHRVLRPCLPLRTQRLFPYMVVSALRLLRRWDSSLLRRRMKNVSSCRTGIEAPCQCIIYTLWTNQVTHLFFYRCHVPAANISIVSSLHFFITAPRALFCIWKVDLYSCGDELSDLGYSPSQNRTT